MNPNEQNQNQSKPDYSFITSQPDASQTPHKNNKKVIVLIVALFMLMISMGLVTFFGSEQNIQKDSSGGNSEDPKAVVSNYLELLAQDNIDEAHNLVNETARPPKEIFEQDQQLRLQDVVSLSTCEVSDEVTDYEGYKQVSVTCKATEDERDITYVFYLISRNNKALGIEKFMVKLESEVA